MAEGRRYAIAPQLDIEQILKEAQHRWLRPAEICEILKNYRNFRIAPEPPNRPTSGSLFLFDRKVLRYFRKDGHNWRKKKDGKTVKEAHERLKSGSIDVLHCYYAHGEENENFQRRTYWMLEEDFMHIVLVHYLEVKGGKSSSRIRGNDDMLQAARTDSPLSQLPSQTTEGESSLSGQAFEYEETESDIYSGGAGYYPFSWMQQHENGGGHVMSTSVSSSYVPASSVGNHQGLPSTATNTSFYSHGQDTLPVVLNESGLGFAFNGADSQLDLSSWNGVKPDKGIHQMPPPQVSVPSEQFPFTEGSGVESFTFDEVYSNGLGIKDADVAVTDQEELWQLTGAIGGSFATEDSFQRNDRSLEEAINYPLLKTQSSNLSDILKDSFKKSDSFTRWMSKELGEVDDSQIKSNSGVYWNSEETDYIIEASSRDQLDQLTVGPELAQDQLFSIVDFSPSWTYAGSKTRVLITGRFLNSNEVKRCKWSCMFGEVEVSAEILADGTLRCYSPSHKPGRVPFYVTCSNRLACSEIREFEFRPSDPQYMDAPSPHGSTNKTYLQMRLDKLLSLGQDEYQVTVSNPTKKMIDLSNKISSLMMDNDAWSMLLKLADDNELATDDKQDQLFEKCIKKKLHIWLVHTASDDGKGPSVLDEEGQGVLHLAAALGYDWAIRPTITAGLNINFRDAHGWTALHWAAFCGRERTVVALIALGAAPGALTDPTPDYPSGSTPADLASLNGHKGISGFLAESSLTSHLHSLNLKEAMGSNASEISGLPGIGDFTERRASPLAGQGLQAGSMEDSLGAVRNAAQAAARIYQVFRVQSFQRKQAVQYEDDSGAISDERALSLLSVKPSKQGQLDPLHAAATRIQNKYRGWKGRKEFILIRQRIVKIQAHVRGHQVRKHYRKIVWSVGIVEKVILRWRRRGAGLRGFRSTEGAMEGTSSSNSDLIRKKPAEDDYDFLQEGRKHTEERLQKALARVKSMVQYPDARDQYQRILTVVTKMQESQAMQEKMLEESTEMDESFLRSEFKELWDDDMPMPGYF
ncbi:calmodulin-binding transcription activator 2-like isoform X2 [Phragmites australis]|uniref:calmodulin-binding transcription activator 2-like isoform X2 n=1 Tax=Phragmites australis TaxID=29695 RepID=UPI002D778E66|nr:calmodulin-binding transcription activator 2-like isoform X2 [Phragmites australis]